MATPLVRKCTTTYTQTSDYLYANAHLLSVVARSFDHVLYRKGKDGSVPPFRGGPLPLGVRGLERPGTSHGEGIPVWCGGSSPTIADPMAGIADPMAPPRKH